MTGGQGWALGFGARGGPRAAGGVSGAASPDCGVLTRV